MKQTLFKMYFDFIYPYLIIRLVERKNQRQSTKIRNKDTLIWFMRG